MTNNKHYPIIVFDFGGVLINWDPRGLYENLFEGDTVAMEKFFTEVDFMAWNLEQDKGRSFAEAVAVLSQEFPQYASFIAAYDERWEESISGPILETVEILRLLKQNGYRLFGLSNWSAETFPRIQHKYEFFNWFEGIVLSGAVKLIKPAPEIYNILLEQIGEPAEKCLFIDDSKPNITTANELGFMTIHFESPSQLKTELSMRGIL
ncbi:HAD family phosphatase [Anaerolineales bacterium HSG6]|nr:HAD family phosphatase [Anaerolineales bacterium HSG6]